MARIRKILIVFAQISFIAFGQDQVELWPDLKSRETTCFECANQRNRKFCTLGGDEHSRNSKWTGKCCLPSDSTDSSCQSTSENICSDTYENSGGTFFSFCQHSTDPHICLDSLEHTKTKFAAQNEPFKFKKDNLVRDSAMDQF